MKKMVGLMHTTVVIVDPIQKLFREMLPDVSTFNLVDEGIAQILSKTGAINCQVVKRMCNLAVMADEVGCDLCLWTCSASVSAVDIAQRVIGVPILKINEPMFENAIERGNKIGLLMTDPATVEPSLSLLMETAKAVGKKISVQSKLNSEALSIRLSGDVEKHDELLLDSIAELADQVDIIVLVQASMASVAKKAQEITDVPILTSPKFAVEKIGQLLHMI